MTECLRYRCGNVPNTERGRYIKWIYPSVLLTYTDHNEMITVYMSFRNDQKLVEIFTSPNAYF